jgi:LysM repeat protein
MMSMNYGPETFEYTIQPQDTLWDLADDLNITVEDIMALNVDLEPNNLYAGQVINLPDNLPIEASQRRPYRRPDFDRGRRFRRYPYARRPYYPYYPYEPYYPYY